MVKKNAIKIGTEALRALKIQAAMDGWTMESLVERMIMEYVAANKEGRQHP